MNESQSERDGEPAPSRESPTRSGPRPADKRPTAVPRPSGTSPAVGSPQTNSWIGTRTPTPVPARPNVPPTSSRVIVGVKPESPEGARAAASPDLLSRFLPTVSKLAGAISSRDEDASAVSAPAPPPVEMSAPPSAAMAPSGPPVARGVTVDRLLIQVTSAQVKKAAQVLTSRGIKNQKIEGDSIEFECASTRVATVLRALIDAHIELYGLARMAVDGAAAPPGGP
jgi:hypothetical protein